MFNNLLSCENLQKMRNNKITDYLCGNILELGCGTGFIPKYLIKNNKNNRYTGIDFERDNIRQFSEQFKSYRFIEHDLNELIDIQDEEFDTVISAAVIEHIYNQKNFFITATKFLKKGGRIVITTPSNFGNDIIYPMICKLGYRKGKGVLSYHTTIYNRDRIEVVARDFGLEIEHFEHFEFFCNQLIVYKKI